MNYTEPVTFEFFWFYNDQTVRRKGPDGPRIGVFLKIFSCLE
jgi:hypothetical protein